MKISIQEALAVVEYRKDQDPFAMVRQDAAVLLAAEVRRLQSELAKERKRLDWALKNEAVYYCHGNVWRLCFSGDIYCTDEDIPTANPRATIDELMEKQ